jgi:hypothetical protein
MDIKVRAQLPNFEHFLKEVVDADLWDMTTTIGCSAFV